MSGWEHGPEVGIWILKVLSMKSGFTIVLSLIVI